jgi:hypothetical protein
MKNSIRTLMTTALVFGIVFISHAGPSIYILGKLKYIITAPNGDEYYKCKNRAQICVEIETLSDELSSISLHTESGIITKEISSYELSEAYNDEEWNEIIDLRITPAN